MVAVSGIGICGGTRINLSLVATAILLAMGLPALTGALLQNYWPIGTFSFSWALWMYLGICLMTGIFDTGSFERDRILTALGCIVASILGAWIGSKIRKPGTSPGSD